LLLQQQLISDGSYSLNYSSDKSCNSSGGWMEGETCFSSTGNCSQYWARDNGFGLYFLNATAVPEPGTLALISLGGVALFFARKKCL
jgi:hypothetical protein